MKCWTRPPASDLYVRAQAQIQAERLRNPTPIVVRRTEAGLVWIPKTITLVKFVIFPSKTHGRADPAATEDLSRLWLAWLDRYLR